MGIIYKLTFPSGKSYIGQTIQTFAKRMSQHKMTNDCKVCHAAFLKYGAENVIKEIILYCDKEDLDMYEEKFIALYNTVVPNGYNVMPGGVTRIGQYVATPETRAKISLAASTRIRSCRPRKHDCGFDLPKYVNYIKPCGGNAGGFTVSDTNNKAIKSFKSKKLSLEDKYKLAIDYYNTIHI